MLLLPRTGTEHSPVIVPPAELIARQLAGIKHFTRMLRALNGPRERLQLMVLEARAIAEFTTFLAGAAKLQNRKGDGHPIMVEPGFFASDELTLGMRWLLHCQGYAVHGWGQGINVGPTNRILDGLEKRFLEIYERYQQPVSLAGWSLGGDYALDLARSHPEKVRDVITLGTPLRMTLPDTTGIHTPLRKYLRPYLDSLYEFVGGQDGKPLIAVPTTAIHSSDDGVVRQEDCIDHNEGGHHENIGVQGSHFGLAHNFSVLYAMTDREAQPLGEWKPFVPSEHAKAHFPGPVVWEPRELRRELVSSTPT